MTAEYDAWAVRHRQGSAADRAAAAKAVRSWLKSTDLAVSQNVMSALHKADARYRRRENLPCVHEEQVLAKLPPEERQAWQELWAKVATLAAREPAAQFDQARTHVARLEWAKAAACYAAGIELEPTDNSEVWFEYAAAQLLAGDRAGYCRTCAHMMACCQPTGKMRPYLVARACTLAPDSTTDPNQPFLLSASEVFDRGEFWALTEQAALHFRRGQTKDALECAERSLVADGRTGRAVLNWLWLALTYQKLGNTNEARRWLVKATNWLDQQGGRMPLETAVTGLHLHNWLDAHVLRQEAETQLR